METGQAKRKTIVNVIFHQFKSIVQGQVQPGKIAFNNIPSGEKITIVALKTVDNKILLAVKETEATRNGEVMLDFQQLTLELLKKEMEKLDKLY